MCKALILLSIVLSTPALAEGAPSLLAANAWLGVGYSLATAGGAGESGLAAELGGAVGIRVLPAVALTVVGEWGPVIGDVPKGFTSLVRGGLGVRLEPLPTLQILLTPQWAGWVQVRRLHSGVGGEALALVELDHGWGFYAKVGYHTFKPSRLDLQVLVLSAGASYSF